LVQRYSDAPPATLTVPTAASFAAAKTVAWVHRSASRDSFDLSLLARSGAINGDAARLFARYGPTNKSPDRSMFSKAPDEETWRRDLSAQTRLSITAEEALTIAADAWGSMA
jgi:hypothetical protein